MEANKTIRWKVIEKNDRESIFIDHKRYTHLYLQYLKGKITKALPFTLGCMCFDTRKNAQRFVNKFTPLEKKCATIIKVKTYGRGKRPQDVVSFIHNITFNPEEGLLQWSRNRKKYFYDACSRVITVTVSNPEKGTICYPAVMPLA